MPEGLEDCSKLTKITEALLRKGPSESDVRKILGENTLRVLEQAERVSQELQSQEHPKPLSMNVLAPAVSINRFARYDARLVVEHEPHDPDIANPV